MVIEQAGFHPAGVGTGEQYEVAAVELVVGNGDQGIMSAPVVPPQHAAGRVLGGEQAQDAFDIAGYLIVAVFLDLSRRLEERRRRELLAVAHHHNLAAPHHRAQGVYRLHLAGLIEHHQVELDAAGAEVGRDGKRAHHEDRLYRLDGIAGPFQKLADGQVAPAHLELPPQHRQLTAALVSGHTLPVRFGQPGPVVDQDPAVQGLEGLPDLVVGRAIE